MKPQLLSALAVSLFVVPAAFGQEDMSCAAFVDLDAAAQAEALASLESAPGAGDGDGQEADPAAATDEAVPEPGIGVTEPETDAVAVVAPDVSAEDVAQICRDNANLSVLEAVKQAQSPEGP